MSYVHGIFCIPVVRIEWQVVALGVLHGGLLMRCFNLVSVFKEISNLIKEMSGETVYYGKLHRFYLL